MTRHSDITMYHEDRRITDPAVIRSILGMTEVAAVAIHRESFSLRLKSSPPCIVVPFAGNHGSCGPDEL